jgi:hypothetical protein
MRISRIATAAVVLLVAACGDGVQRVDGPAAPIAGSPAPSATSTAPTSPATTPPTTPSITPASRKPTTAAPKSDIIGPKGYRALQLGMSQKAATATGLIDPWKTSGDSGCIGYSHLRKATGDSGNVLFSSKLGVVVIDAPSADVRTPEGIHIGSTLAALLKAYPNWERADADGPGPDGRGWAKVPGNSDAYYRTTIEGGKVTELTLQHKDQDCYE